MLVRLTAPASTQRSLQYLADALTNINTDYLRRWPETPPLLSSGVVYRRERDGTSDDDPVSPAGVGELFDAIPIVLERGWGDCDDLAPWRAAELRVHRGVAARAVVVAIRPGLWHVVVRLPDGRTLDPCRKLGMRGRG